MGLRCHSEYCWSCPADTGLGPATHGTFCCLLSAWALVQDLYQSGGQDTAIFIFFFFKLKNTEGAGAIKYLWKKDWHGEGLKYSPHRIHEERTTCSFQIPWQIFFKQDTEREVKVNPTGLFWEHLSGVYVGVCNCARVYGYVEMCQIPLLKWVWQSRYTLNTTGATMWTTGPRILEHEPLYKSHSKVKTNIPHLGGLWQGMLYSSKCSWKLPPSTCRI